MMSEGQCEIRIDMLIFTRIICFNGGLKWNAKMHGKNTKKQT